MTLYAGGKKRIGKEIADIISKKTKEIEESEDFKVVGYCEPFCGMMGVYQYIPELFEKHIPKLKYQAGDRNPYLIKLWKGLQDGYKPPTSCSKKEYYKYKDEDAKSLKAIFVGFACAMRGVFRTTYFPNNNVALQAEHSVDIGNKIKNVKLKVGEYDSFSNLKGYIIYCDPPYKNSGSPYSIGEVYSTKFDYDRFVDWCIDMSKDNIIFISEYEKPCRECKLVWKKGNEKLFLI